MTKGIIFDLYNTLIYSGRKINPYTAFFSEIGITKTEKGLWLDRVLKENFNSFEEIKNEIYPESKIYTQKYDYMVEEEIEGTNLYDDTYESLEYLKDRYDIFLLSNAATPYKKCFYDLGLDKYIKDPFFSCDLGYRKPEKEIFDIVVNKSGFKRSELVMIGDSMRSDYEGAINSGIRALLKNKPLKEIISSL